MLLHKNHKLIYKNVAAIEIPNNVYLDPCPDPCPVEGLVLYSEDMCTRADINFITTEKDARSFLEEGSEVYESFQSIKPLSSVSTNGVEGFSMTYATSRYIYEEYVFTIPGDDPTLLNICIEQRKERPADSAQYAQLVEELLAGIKII